MIKSAICKMLVGDGLCDEDACRQRDVAKRRHWIFYVHPRFPNEADCLPLTSTNHGFLRDVGRWTHFDGEFWDSVPTSESPLGTKDKDTINATIERLDVGYRDHLIECKNESWIHFEKDPRKRYTHQLRAISGDCAAGGMSDKGDILPFTEDNLVLVYDYLLANLKFHRSVAVNGLTSNKAQKANRHFYDCAHEMERMQIFQHKWHARTGWVVEEFDQWEMLK